MPCPVFILKFYVWFNWQYFECRKNILDIFPLSVVTCGAPDSIGNGTFSPALSLFNYSSIVTYACNYGYYKLTGDLVHTCNENATWTGSKPVCLSKTYTYKKTHSLFTINDIILDLPNLT